MELTALTLTEALALLGACEGVPSLLRLLRGGADAPVGMPRILAPPEPLEPLLRDAALLALALVARLGGASLLLSLIHI